MAKFILVLLLALAGCGGGDPEPMCHPVSEDCPPAVVDYPTIPCPSQYDPTQLCQVHPTVQPVHCDGPNCH